MIYSYKVWLFYGQATFTGFDAPTLNKNNPRRSWRRQKKMSSTSITADEKQNGSEIFGIAS